MPQHTKLYSANHHRVNKVRGAAKLQLCAHCGHQAGDWATLKGLDSENESVDPWTGFIPLCKKCHKAYDRAGKPSPWLGKHHTAEAREKLRQIKLGKSNHTPASRQRISDALKGRAKSPETRERMRQAQQERRRSTARTQAERLEGKHGTPTGYRYGCRCTACKDARNAYRRAAYQAAKEVPHAR